MNELLTKQPDGRSRNHPNFNANRSKVFPDVFFCIVMTSCSTLLALGMMPLMLYIYCQGFSNLQEAIPYIDIIISLVLILVPCGSGILINHFRPQYSKIIIRAGLTIMAISMIAVNIIAITHMGGVILVMLSSSLIAIGALMPLIGYTLGYVISSLFKLNHAERRTVSMETGCQNIQLCVTILKLAFPPAVAGPLFMFPIIYLSFQLIEAVMLMILLRCYQKFTKKDKETYQPAATGDKLKELS